MTVARSRIKAEIGLNNYGQSRGSAAVQLAQPWLNKGEPLPNSDQSLRGLPLLHHRLASHFKAVQLLLGDASLHQLSCISEADVKGKHSLEKLYAA
jgi:hypothetical protein